MQFHHTSVNVLKEKALIIHVPQLQLHYKFNSACRK